MDIRDIFAQNLRNLRHARGFSQEELAHRASIDRTYVSSLERNVYSPSLDIVDKLAKALNVEAADLLKTDDQGHPIWPVTVRSLSNEPDETN